MENAFTDLQTRESILRILQNRRLEINNVDTLTNEQLFRIYKNFAMPLSRRYKKYRNSTENDYIIGDKEDTNLEFIKQRCTNSMFANDDVVTMPRKRYTCTVVDEPSPMSEALNWLDDYQCQLSTATKRIKISLP